MASVNYDKRIAELKSQLHKADTKTAPLIEKEIALMRQAQRNDAKINHDIPGLDL